MPTYEYIDIGGLKIIAIRNCYNEEQLERLWTAYDYLKDKLLSPKDTGSAEDESGRIKKNNKGIFLEDLMPLPRDLIKDMHETIRKAIDSNCGYPSDSVYRSVPCITSSRCLLQYYSEDNNGYESHNDTSVFTAVMTFNRSPKNFEGGDFYFEDYDVTIPFKHNTGFIFPSNVNHSVLPIKMIDKSTSEGGRLSLTMLTHI